MYTQITLCDLFEQVVRQTGLDDVIDLGVWREEKWMLELWGDNQITSSQIDKLQIEVFNLT